MWTTDEWTGCYPSRWTVLLPEAMSHPAKFSSRLIKRIYEHMQEQNWLHEGDTVVDPFGGTGLGALDAMRLGFRWRGVELEGRFVELGGMSYACPGFTKEWWKRYFFRPAYIQALRREFRLCPSCETAMKPITKSKAGKVVKREIPAREAHVYRGNIALWNHKYSRAPHWCQDALLVKGDSRKLLEILKSGRAAVSSPPYADSVNQGEEANDSGARLDRKARAGVDNSKASTLGGPHSVLNQAQVYGASDGQLGAMKANGFEAAISSPPYAETTITENVNFFSHQRGTPARELRNEGGDAYGKSDGQLGGMKAGGFDAAISSPPYADGAQHTGGDDPHPEKLQGGTYHGVGLQGAVSSPPYKTETQGGGLNVNKPATFRGVLKDGSLSMGESDGNLGQMDDANFQAAISSPPFEQRSADGGWQMLGQYAEEGRLTVKQVKGDRGKIYPSWDKERDTSYGESDGQMSNMDSRGFEAAISSPPFRHSEGGTGAQGGTIDNSLMRRHAAGNSAAEGYGRTEGQLANMEEGSFESAVSSPPYNLPMSQTHNGKRGGARGTTPSETGAFVKYGNEEGQLEGMDMEGFEAAISSPPFEKSLSTDLLPRKERVERARELGISNAEYISPIDMEKIGMRHQTDYGDSDGQLGADSGDDFWLAARQILEQVYLALEPGGHAVWVTKDFVKNKARVPFSGQWRQLCEAVGFVTLHEHRSMLVRHKGTSITLEGKDVKHTVQSKSFFRRLAEKKGSPEINWETIWCMVKPTAEVL